MFFRVTLTVDESLRPRPSRAQAILFGYFDHMRGRGFTHVHLRVPPPNDADSQVCVRACACLRACVRVCARARVFVCMRACACALLRRARLSAHVRAQPRSRPSRPPVRRPPPSPYLLTPPTPSQIFSRRPPAVRRQAALRMTQVGARACMFARAQTRARSRVRTHSRSHR